MEYKTICVLWFIKQLLVMWRSVKAVHSVKYQFHIKTNLFTFFESFVLLIMFC